MKWLKTFDELLTEKIHNKKLVQYEVDKMLDGKDLYFNKGNNDEYILTFEPISPDHLKRNESIDL